MISFIIPIYNAENSIKACIKSIQAQNFKNIEIICVNDGSTDNSLVILKELKSKDNRIKIINQTNSGAFQARKSGILASTGDYIMFVDSDDRLCNKETCKLVVDVFNNHPVQLVQFATKKKIGFITQISKLSVEGIITKNQIIEKYYKDYLSSMSDGVITVVLWNKAFIGGILRDAVKECNTSLRLGEDLLLLLNYIFHKDVLAIYNKNEICYLYNSGIGYSNTLDGRVLKDYGDLKNYQLKICDDWNLCEEAVYYCNLETIYFLFVMVKNMINKQLDKKVILDFINESSGYNCILVAKRRLKMLNTKFMYDELKFLVSDYTDEEYYNYCINSLSKISFVSKLKSIVKKYFIFCINSMDVV